jgi:hypothetical protein
MLPNHCHTDAAIGWGERIIIGKGLMLLTNVSTLEEVYKNVEIYLIEEIQFIEIK